MSSSCANVGSAPTGARSSTTSASATPHTASVVNPHRHSYNTNHQHTQQIQYHQQQNSISQHLVNPTNNCTPTSSRSRSLKRSRAPSPVYSAPNPVTPYCTVTSILWDSKYTSVGRPDFADYYKQFPVPVAPIRVVDETDDIDGIDQVDDSDDELSDDIEEDNEGPYHPGPGLDKEGVQRSTSRPTSRPTSRLTSRLPQFKEKLKRARSRTKSRSRSRDTCSPRQQKEFQEEGKVIENNKNSTMEKRHPSSFQQLEKLGEGTYATVSFNQIT